MSTHRFTRGLWFIPFFWVNTVFLGILSLIVSIWSVTGSRRFARIWGMLNVKAAGVRINIEGLVNLPSRQDDPGGVIAASNHSSAADIGVILAGLPLDVCWVTKASLQKIPILGWHLKRVHIPVSRKESGNIRKFLKDGAQKIQDGAAVVIFPEGTRNSGLEKLLPFKKGAFLLARAAKRPIIPIAVIGSWDVWPEGTYFPQKGEITMRIGKPIIPSEHKIGGLEALSDVTRQAILDLLSE